MPLKKKKKKKFGEKQASGVGVGQVSRDGGSHYSLEIGVIEVLPDHVHFTLSAPPRIAPARAIQILKSVFTRLLFKEFPWLKKEYWGGELWIAGYFTRSVGPGLTKEQIEQYIEEQAEEI